MPERWAAHNCFKLTPMLNASEGLTACFLPAPFACCHHVKGKGGLTDKKQKAKIEADARKERFSHLAL